VQHKATVEQINRSAAAARSAMGGDLGDPPGVPAGRDRNAVAAKGDDFLEHYFKRIDPQVAASFTPAQQQAIKTMFGGRGVNSHAVDLRRGFSIGRSRFYMVLLLGREHRALGTLPGSGLGRLFGYFVLALVLLVPILAAVYLLKTLAGIDVLAAGGLPTGIIAQEQPSNLPPL
jgi:hypothetical protein